MPGSHSPIVLRDGELAKKLVELFALVGAEPGKHVEVHRVRDRNGGAQFVAARPRELQQPASTIPRVDGAFDETALLHAQQQGGEGRLVDGGALPERSLLDPGRLVYRVQDGVLGLGQLWNACLPVGSVILEHAPHEVEDGVVESHESVTPGRRVDGSGGRILVQLPNPVLVCIRTFVCKLLREARSAVRLIVGMTGATGAPLGVRLLEHLHELPEVETHLVMSRWARTTIELETRYGVRQVAKLADVVHGAGDQAASVSSGSFRTDGMVIVPCSMKTLAGVRTGYADGLIGRAADVVLKERRKLVAVPRETPLSEIHLENMLALSRMGAVIVPPMPAFYNGPESVDDIVEHVVTRVLDQFDLPSPGARRWNGLHSARQEPG